MMKFNTKAPRRIPPPNLPFWECKEDLYLSDLTGKQVLAFTKGGFYRQLDWSVDVFWFYNDNNIRHQLDSEAVYTFFKKVEPPKLN